MSAVFGEIHLLEQESGDNIRLKVLGDEYNALYLTLSGYPAVYDLDYGLYCYAHKEGTLYKSSGIPVSKPYSDSIGNNPNETNGDMSTGIINHHVPTLATETGLLEGRRICRGKVLGLTVLVEFANVSSKVSAHEVEEMLNGEYYSANGNSCSVRRYFELVSNGLLHYQNIVVGPVKLKNKRKYYRNNLLVEEALDIVVNELNIDLTQFDSLNEGIVDAVNFLYAGKTQYQGNLWPHNSSVLISYKGMRIQSYMIDSYGRKSSDLSIGTFCHETGHLLCRFPDLYDYGFRDKDYLPSHGLGNYCLMATGNSLAKGRKPCAICGYLRSLAGWIGNEVILNDGGLFSAVHGKYGSIHKYLTNKYNEFFIVENRCRMGLDIALPSSGLAVYHCDIKGSNEWQQGTLKKHYQCYLLQADGANHLENNSNEGDSGDLFTEKEGLVLASSTNPSSQHWDGSDSGLIISKVTDPGRVINFRVENRSIEDDINAVNMEDNIV